MKPPLPWAGPSAFVTMRGHLSPRVGKASGHGFCHVSPGVQLGWSQHRLGPHPPRVASLTCGAAPWGPWAARGLRRGAGGCQLGEPGSGAAGLEGRRPLSTVPGGGCCACCTTTRWLRREVRQPPVPGVHVARAVLSLEQAPSNSTAWQAYNAGVKMGCWGLVIYAATGAICSGEWFPGACLGGALPRGSGLPASGKGRGVLRWPRGWVLQGPPGGWAPEPGGAVAPQPRGGAGMRAWGLLAVRVAAGAPAMQRAFPRDSCAQASVSG